MKGGLKRISFWKRRKDYKHVRVFGADQLPATLGRTPLPITNQYATDYCTAFCTAGAGGYLNGVPMSPEWQTANEGFEAGEPIYGGIDPHTALNAARHRGFLPTKDCPLSFAVQGFQTPAIWQSYAQDVDNLAVPFKPGSFAAVTPDYDAIKEALYQAKDENGVVMAFGFWFEEFNTAAGNPASHGIVPVPKSSAISSHAYLFIDWKTIDGTEYLVAQLSQGAEYGDGGLLYFSKDVVTAAFPNPLFNGLGCYIFSTVAQTQIQIDGLYKQVIELLREIVSMLTPVKGTTASLSTLATELRLMLVALGIMKSMEPTAQPANVDTLVPWTGKENCRHNVRVLCDLEGLNEQQKDALSSTVNCESGYSPSALNKNVVNGKLASTDYGICQINDYWHIGEGKDFPSAEYVLQNPEACIRWMCKQWLAGNANAWVCHLKGMYRNYSS